MNFLRTESIFPFKTVFMRTFAVADAEEKQIFDTLFHCIAGSQNERFEKLFAENQRESL